MHIKSITIRGFKSYKDEGACAPFSRNAQKKKKKKVTDKKSIFAFFFSRFLACVGGGAAQCAWTTCRRSTTPSVSSAPLQRRGAC